MVDDHPTPAGSTGRRPNGDSRLWRRLALALPLSLILHLGLVFLLSPDHRPVADHAIDLDVIEVAPGPPVAPPGPPPSEPEEAPPPPEPSPPPPEPGADQAPEPEEPPAPSDIVAVTEPATTADAGPAGGGPDGATGVIAAGGARDAGVKGGGICMHDLFGYSEDDPSWMLWISLASLRDTAFEQGIASTLTGFSLGELIARSTGIRPVADSGGILVTAGDIFDPRTFRVVTSYETGEGQLRGALDRATRKTGAVRWQKTKQGWEGADRRGHTWHLVGSGRVLALTPGPVDDKPAPPPELAPNPFDRPAARDAGPPKADASVGTPTAPPAIPDGEFPGWPRQVSCIGAPGEGETPPPAAERAGLVGLGRSFLAPDGDGRWPVALLATRDGRAVGLAGLSPRRAGKRPRFVHARFRAYLSEPIRVEGEVVLEGEEPAIKALARLWLRVARATAADPFFALAGLNHLLDDLTLTPAKDRIRFSVDLTEGKVRAALIFLQLQGEALERQLKEPAP